MTTMNHATFQRKPCFSPGNTSCSRNTTLFSSQWSQVHAVGAGLQNMGNTCFLNAALQCLTYTAPLSNYMLSGDHSKSCQNVGFCMTCSMQNHISQVFSNSGNVLKPALLSDLKQIAPYFEVGTQEDAHEFLGHIMRAMQESSLISAILNQQPEATTPIQQIFRGQLRSRVACCECEATSDSFEPYDDIPVVIKDTTSITEALDHFVLPEPLDCYNCRKCMQTVQATKTVNIHCSSNVLAFYLMRFADYSGNKIMKYVKYPEYLDMSCYMSESPSEPLFYKLYAVLVHEGSKCYSGHYYCYVKGSDEHWYKMNDEWVSVSDIRTVLKQQAYMLFYIRSTEPNQGDCIPRGPDPDLLANLRLLSAFKEEIF